MAIPNNHFDELVSLALETQTVVTTRRKQIAWQQVQKRAARQTIIAPYAIPPAPLSPRLGSYQRLMVFVSAVVSVVLTDERRYHRAAENRRSNEGLMFCLDQAIHFYPSNLVSIRKMHG